MQMLLENTTPEQRKERKYQIQYDTNGETPVSSAQRSWIQLMLRKNIGHKNVAFFIWQHGLPDLIDTPLRKQQPSLESLQRILADGIRWYASLLQSLVVYSEDLEMEHARQMSDLGLTAWFRPRRQTFVLAKETFKLGKRLCEERDSKKRCYEEMSATERFTVEDYD